MSNEIFNRLSNVVAVLKKSRLKQTVLTLFMSGLLMLSTACSSAPAAQASNSDGRASVPGTYQEKAGQNVNLYDPIQPKVGGANDYNDSFTYDRRPEEQAKAKALVDKAQRRADSIDNPQEYVENLRDNAQLGERARNASEQAKNKLGEAKDRLSEGTEKGMRNLKGNTERAGETIQRAAEDVKQNVQAVGKDVSKQAGRVAEDTSDLAKNKVQEAANAVQRTGQDKVESMRDRM